MAKPEWGTKRLCQSCGCRFYDLKRNPIDCPSCGARFDLDALLKSRRARPAPVAKPPKPPPAAVVADKDDGVEAAAAEIEDADDDTADDDTADDDTADDDDVLVAAADLDDDGLADVVVKKDSEESS